MNVKLLRKIQKHILAEPRRLNMSHWAAPSHDAPCGTMACIAGWAVILTKRRGAEKFRRVAERLGIGLFPDPKRITLNPSTVAAKALRLDLDQKEKLFHTYGWPWNFREKYLNAENPRIRARAASDRIDHFIATHGKE